MFTCVCGWVGGWVFNHSTACISTHTITLAFVGDDSPASVDIRPLNQTRTLSKPTQELQLPESTSFHQDSKSVGGMGSVAAASTVAMPIGGAGQLQLGSTSTSLRSSLTSLTSFKPDVVLGGSQADIAFRSEQGFQKMSQSQSQSLYSTRPVPKTSTIDAHADPQGQIAIMTSSGSKVQPDLSPHQLHPQLAAFQKSPPSMPLARGPLQYVSPPSGSAQPVPVASSSLAGWTHQSPTSISPKRGGTVSWGVPPSTASDIPKLSPPPPPAVSTLTTLSQSKPSSMSVSLSHSSSAPSLVKPPNKSVLHLGQETAKNGLAQPFGQAFSSLKFGGSTNPLGELKRSDPVGDLTQIRTSAQKGSSPAGGGPVGDGLVGHQASSVSVPNVAISTKSDMPPSLDNKFTSSLSSGLAPFTTSSSGITPFSLGGLTGLATTSSYKPPTGSVTGLSTTSPPKPFTGPTTLLPSTSKTSPFGGASSIPSSFPFGGQSGQGGFTFKLGSSTTPSFKASHSEPPKTVAASTFMQATPTTTKQTAGGSGSFLSSMPKFNLGAGGSSPFQFSTLLSSAGGLGSSSSTPTSSKTTVTAPSLSGGPKFPFLSTLQPTGAATSTKPPFLAPAASSLPSSVSTATPQSSLSWAPPGSSGFVFGDSKGINFGLSSIISKAADASKPPDKGETEEGSESGSSGGSTDASGSGGQDETLTAQEVISKPPVSSEDSTASRPMLPASLPAVQKLHSGDVSKAIPQIVKPTAPKPSPGEGAIDAVADISSSGTKELESKSEKEPQAIEQRTETKPSPSPPHTGVAEVKEQSADSGASRSPEGGEPVEPVEPVETKVEDVEKPKLETAPQTITTTATTSLPVDSQQPQVTTGIATTVQDIAKTTTTQSSTVQLSPQLSSQQEDSKVEVPPPQVPSAPEAEKKLEGNAKKIVTPVTGSGDTEKQPVLGKPAETTASSTATVTGGLGGLSFVGTQPQAGLKGSESQGSLLSLDDVDTEADMEGEMEGSQV